MADLVHHEQVKLAASFINTVAAAFIIVGALSPIVSLSYGGQAAPALLLYASLAIWWQALLIGLWIAVGLSLHLLARASLRRLKE